MRIRTALAAAVLSVAVPGVAHADTTDPPAVPATPGAWIAGVGDFTYREPGTDGHRIRFSVLARVGRDGDTHGVFGYRHLLPDGQVVGEGTAEVVCVNVRGSTAMIAAVVPDGQGNVVNHGFYVTIVAGRPDLIENVQAGGDPDRPAPRYCVDTAPYGLTRYPLDRGGFTFGRLETAA